MKAVILIANALVWAAAMLIGAQYFEGQPIGETWFLWMIVGWTVANGLLVSFFVRKPRRNG